MLWVRDDNKLIDMVHKFKFTYLLDIGSLVGEENLRGDPYKPPPNIDEETLKKLMI